MVQALPAILAAAGPIMKGVAGLSAGNANKRAAYEAAREREALGAAEELRIREEARRAIGAQAATLGSGGFEGNTGSALDALLESQVQAAMDVLMVRRSRGSEARSLRTQGDQAQQEGRMALVGGLIGAGSAFLGMKNDWAQARAGMGTPPAGKVTVGG